MSFLIGAAKQTLIAEFSPAFRGVPLNGWGDPHHRANRIDAPIYARAIAIQRGATLVFWVCLDICFVTEILRQEVLKRTGLSEDALMMTATHNHSAPGGYSSYLFYNLPSDGFIPQVLEAYATATVLAIEKARRRLEPAVLRFDSGKFPDELPVAFNRSLHAWNRNPEVKIPVRENERHLAVDREMNLLLFESPDGRPLACWNWFAVHSTSMHRDRHAIHPDHKGLASSMMEDLCENPEFVAVFAQGAAGDVTPNFRRYFCVRELRGAFRSDEKSCRYVARLQVEQAQKLLASARSKPTVESGVELFTEYSDFSGIEVSPDFAGGLSGKRTGAAVFGIPLLYGTAEGRGIPGILYRIFKWLIAPSNDPIQEKKRGAMQLGLSKVFGRTNLPNFRILDFLHPILKTYRRIQNAGDISERPFSPCCLPIQLCRIGSILIVALPVEFTTMSGRRARRLLQELWKPHGVRHVVIQCYSNSYASYVCTPEEYDEQAYEGGCTHFGRWTLPAFLTTIRTLSFKIFSGRPLNELKPVPAPERYLRIMARNG